MQMPLEINYRHINESPALDAAIREKAAKLEHFHPRLTGCRVTVEAPHRKGHQGALYQVHIRLTVPGAEIVVSHDSPDKSHEDVYVAIRDAFDAARRQLEDQIRIQRG